ncbi:fasciclin domain-containing protein [Aequorivita echinoideorum]|uniref:Fasciclin domain-containing protein n=1 Tax=Aequorivita echinoideorum TaxID=1549647 RepID=A0ABS5S783_9FLAO|nr:fasciclin domain-containing protein [Aequorivita echinoideorum]MBT0609086.1 fasciclin domain-containing protein [Aequorivita echinoideorum]
MHTLRPLLLVFILVTSAFSCKNDVKDETPTSQEDTTQVPPKAEKKELTEKDVSQINSVMSRLMSAEESKKYTSFLVSAGLTEVLSNEAGPFTILAPANEAFDSLAPEKMQFLLNPANKENLSKLLKSHIVEGKYDSATMVQSIKKNSGKLMLKTLDGSSLTASTRDMDIIITDQKGTKAVMIKSDINGSNGVVHVISKVLNVN